MEKPDVDSIEGLSPAISIDQKTTSRNPRSTVGTVTEIYDYLRLLWARIGMPHCPECGEEITGQTQEQIVDRLMTLEEGTKFMVMAPVVRGRKGEYGKLLEQMRLEGYSRVKVDGELRRLDEEIVLDKKYKHDISVVVDRLVMKTGPAPPPLGVGRGRRRRSPAAWSKSRSSTRRPTTTLLFSEQFACLNCGTSIPELEPRIFSFNSPHGACERCHGLGFQRVIDPELVVPDPTLSLAEGALQPWNRGVTAYWKRLIAAVAEELRRRRRQALVEAEEGRARDLPLRHRRGAPPGHLHQPLRPPPLLQGPLRGDRQQPPAPLRGDRLRDQSASGSRATWPSSRAPSATAPGCGPESLAVKVGGISIAEYSALSARAAGEWIATLEMTETERAIARLIVREITERLAFLENVGIGYLSLARSARSLSGGEAQRIRLATQIGSSLVGVMYVLDEPSIGLHQRDNEKLIATLDRLRDLGNTVIVVEHDEGTMRAADHLVDLGPGRRRARRPRDRRGHAGARSPRTPPR